MEFISDALWSSEHLWDIRKKSVFVVHSLLSQNEGQIHPGVAPQTENLRAGVMAARTCDNSAEDEEALDAPKRKPRR